jgi:hypothetical protein
LIEPDQLPPVNIVLIAQFREPAQVYAKISPLVNMQPHHVTHHLPDQPIMAHQKNIGSIVLVFLFFKKNP